MDRRERRIRELETDTLCLAVCERTKKMKKNEYQYLIVQTLFLSKAESIPTVVNIYQ